MAKHQRRADVFPNRSGGLDMSGSTAPNDGWKIKVMYIELSRKKKNGSLENQTKEQDFEQYESPLPQPQVRESSVGTDNRNSCHDFRTLNHPDLVILNNL